MNQRAGSIVEEKDNPGLYQRLDRCKKCSSSKVKHAGWLSQCRWQQRKILEPLVAVQAGHRAPWANTAITSTGSLVRELCNVAGHRRLRMEEGVSTPTLGAWGIVKGRYRMEFWMGSGGSSDEGTRLGQWQRVWVWIESREGQRNMNMGLVLGLWVYMTMDIWETLHSHGS